MADIVADKIKQTRHKNGGRPANPYNDTHAMCSACKDWKEHKEFYARTDHKQGRPVQSRCKPCFNAATGTRRKPRSDRGQRVGMGTGGTKPSQQYGGGRKCAKGQDCVGVQQMGSPTKLSRYNPEVICHLCESKRVDQELSKAQEKASAS